MRIKKREISEKINPELLAKQTRAAVDAVKGELKSDDETAIGFIKSMGGNDVNEDDNDVTNRAISYGVKEPELGPDKHMPKSNNIDYGEKPGVDPDLPFEGVKDKKIVEDGQTNGMGEMLQTLRFAKDAFSQYAQQHGSEKCEAYWRIHKTLEKYDKKPKLSENRKVVKTIKIKDFKK